MSKMEKFTREYCRKVGIKYRMKNVQGSNQLYLLNPIFHRYEYACAYVENLTEEQMENLIDNYGEKWYN